jgi:hypothetical protein
MTVILCISTAGIKMTLAFEYNVNMEKQRPFRRKTEDD